MEKLQKRKSMFNFQIDTSQATYIFLFVFFGKPQKPQFNRKVQRWKFFVEIFHCSQLVTRARFEFSILFHLNSNK